MKLINQLILYEYGWTSRLFFFMFCPRAVMHDSRLRLSFSWLIKWEIYLLLLLLFQPRRLWNLLDRIILFHFLNDQIQGLVVSSKKMISIMITSQLISCNSCNQSVVQFRLYGKYKNKTQILSTFTIKIYMKPGPLRSNLCLLIGALYKVYTLHN